MRGMNQLTKQLEIRRFLYKNNVGLYGLVETKIKTLDCTGVLANFGQQWGGVTNIQHHPGGRIWLIWIKHNFSVTVLSMSDQHIIAKVVEIVSGNEFLFTVVYGSNDDGEILHLWDDIRRTKDTWNGPWSLCGDFNCLLDFNESIGRPVRWNDIVHFRDCVSYCEMMDLQAQGSFFTWNNKHESSSRVFSRRVVRQWRPHFRYFNMWGQDPHFKAVIKQQWDKKVSGSWMFQVVSKQRSLKLPLKHLNRNRFSDVETAVEAARIRLHDLQLQMHTDPTNTDVLNAESIAADEYRNLSKAHYNFLHQKAKVAWVCEGDENTRYFHNMIRSRQMHNKILQITDKHGQLHRDPLAIEQAFLDFYIELLGTSALTTDVHIPTVRTANKSPGSDGFNSQFYRDSWDIIGRDVIGAVLDFLASGKLLKQVNATTLTLVPKVKSPGSVLEYRPIACCNVLYKCVTKIICTRLGEILPDIVNSSQGGFVKVRNIVENVLICQDLVRLYNRKAASPRCLIKIDLRKAYDTLVMTCVTSPTYSLNVNGNYFGYFHGELATKKDHLWVKWVNHVYMKGCDWKDYHAPSDCRWSWKKIIHMKDKFKQGYVNDLWLNKTSSYSVASGYQWLRTKSGKVSWRFLCWNTMNVPKHSFIYWASQHFMLLTLDRMHKMGMGTATTCYICGMEPEKHEHLFYQCEYNKICMHRLQDYLHLPFPAEDMIKWFSRGRGRSGLETLFTVACFVGVIYAIWNARNRARL
ncbi:uncharacterized protein LOC141588040 [Silene latifolia]|uniref:uncharacterized protein LOC141588040 n=1 Tax=Silene latifolia TaxID=37657 RepID=UPI003D780A3D